MGVATDSSRYFASHTKNRREERLTMNREACAVVFLYVLKSDIVRVRTTLVAKYIRTTFVDLLV